MQTVRHIPGQDTCADTRGTDLENLKMWEPLIELMHSSETGIQRHAIWILGTAVQNNSKAQADVR